MKFVFLSSILVVGGVLVEVNGQEQQCLFPNGTPEPEMSLNDIYSILGKIQVIQANPYSLYSPDGPYTNWDEGPTLNDSLAKLAVQRGILDKYNLWTTYLGGIPTGGKTCPLESKYARTLDGTCNDFESPLMGSVGTRFGRNVMPLHPAAHRDTENLMNPNPREVSRILLTREESTVFQNPEKVPFLNLLAVGWIQFQTHDWFAHTASQDDEPFKIPLSDEDPLKTWYRDSILVKRSKTDTTRTPQEAILPTTYQNKVTHWWDLSQIYGSDEETSNRLRSFKHGKMKVDKKGFLPKADDGFDDTGFRENYWVGISIFHHLFVKEHNAICDMLKKKYPDFTDQELFDKARLINAAIQAKIHTVEWTPAILPNQALEVGLNANWDGLNKYVEPKLTDLPPGVPESFRSVLFGVRNQPKKHKVYPTSEELQAVGVEKTQADKIASVYNGEIGYQLTEEFTSVYRMHSLLPETVTLSKAKKKNDQPSCTLFEYYFKKCKAFRVQDSQNQNGRDLLEEVGLADMMYSFGTEAASPLKLNNFPSFLQNLWVPGQGVIDLGTVDILRDRERGIPRYNAFRRLLSLPPISKFEDLTSDPVLLEKLKKVYNDDVELLDLMIGTFAESGSNLTPSCFGFGETAFQVFIEMASLRLSSDYFFTEGYTPEVYTQEGLDWVESTTMKSLLIRHFPELEKSQLQDVENAFFPWTPVEMKSKRDFNPDNMFADGTTTGPAQQSRATQTTNLVAAAAGGFATASIGAALISIIRKKRSNPKSRNSALSVIAVESNPAGAMDQIYQKA